MITTSSYETHSTAISTAIVIVRTFSIEMVVVTYRGPIGPMTVTQYSTRYYEIPVMVQVPVTVKTWATQLITFSQSRESTYLVTRTLTRTYETKVVEEFEETTKDFLIYALVVALALATGGLGIFARRRGGIMKSEWTGINYKKVGLPVKPSCLAKDGLFGPDPYGKCGCCGVDPVCQYHWLDK